MFVAFGGHRTEMFFSCFGFHSLFRCCDALWSCFLLCAFQEKHDVLVKQCVELHWCFDEELWLLNHVSILAHLIPGVPENKSKKRGVIDA